MWPSNRSVPQVYWEHCWLALWALQGELLWGCQQVSYLWSSSISLVEFDELWEQGSITVLSLISSWSLRNLFTILSCRGQCLPCGCHQRGSLSASCDPQTGQCQCRNLFTGRQCDRCKVSTALILPCHAPHCDDVEWMKMLQAALFLCIS